MVLTLLTDQTVQKDMTQTINSFCTVEVTADEISNDKMSEMNYAVVNHVKTHSQMYSAMKGVSLKLVDDSKTYFDTHNPDLTLLFNPQEFSLGKFPALMREFTEMIN